jgi:hypothetical protein
VLESDHATIRITDDDHVPVTSKNSTAA